MIEKLNEGYLYHCMDTMAGQPYRAPIRCCRATRTRPIAAIITPERFAARALPFFAAGGDVGPKGP
jgi:hypothetical protein